MSRRWMIIVVAAVVVVAAVALTALLVGQSRDDARRVAEAAATSTTGVAAPYDLTELPADTDLDVIEDASFVSILIPNDSGRLTSYGVGSSLPAMQALTKAILDADQVDAQGAGSVTSGASALAFASTLTFVLASRETLTFTLDLDQGLISRGDKAWRPKGDLKALVEAATAGP